MAVNGEMKSSKVALTSGCHGLVKIDHYSRVEESAQGHKQLEIVTMNEPY